MKIFTFTKNHSIGQLFKIYDTKVSLRFMKCSMCGFKIVCIFACNCYAIIVTLIVKVLLVSLQKAQANFLQEKIVHDIL